MTDAVRFELLSSLASVRDDVERQVAKLDRYRALQAVEKTLSEFPGLEDLNRALSDLRDGMQAQLAESREVRALRAVEKILPELSDVLAFLSERSDDKAEQVTPSEPVAPVASVDEMPDAAESKVTVVIATAEDIVAISDASLADITQADPVPQATGNDPLTQPQSEAVAAVDPGEASAPANDTSLSDVPPPPSYGITQFLNTGEPVVKPGMAESLKEGESLAQFRTPPSQEGRAA